MNHKTLLEGLRTKWLGHPTIYYDKTDSTNVRAGILIEDQDSSPHGTAIIAANQTAGKGTGGAKWISDNPDGLLLSIILKFPLKKEPIQFVPALAAVEMLKQVFGIDAHVKWPNDILYKDKKMGGILCEKTGEYCIVGIGLNINQEEFSEEIRRKAISIYQINGKKYPIEKVFQTFLWHFETIYDTNADIIEKWKQNSRMLGKKIQVIRHQVEKLNVTVLDISPEGYLIIQDEANRRQIWVSSSELDINTTY